MHMKTAQILKFTSPQEYTKQKQKQFDIEVKTICLKCLNLIDASDEYWATSMQKSTWEFFFCDANRIESQGDYTIIDPLTWKKTKTLLDDFSSDHAWVYVWKNLLIWETALTHELCRDINEWNCPDYVIKNN